MRRGTDRDDRDRGRVAGIGLAVVAGVKEPDPGSELGSPLSSHASSRCLTDCRPEESHTSDSGRAAAWRAFRRTPGPSLARHRSCEEVSSSRQSGADDPLDDADERMRRWRGMATKSLLRLTFAAEGLGLDMGWCRWDSRGMASSHPRRGWDAKPPMDPGFLRLRQARDGASQCCGPFSSYWSSSRWCYSSFAASAEQVGAVVAAVASRDALNRSPITQSCSCRR